MNDHGDSNPCKEAVDNKSDNAIFISFFLECNSKKNFTTAEFLHKLVFQLELEICQVKALNRVSIVNINLGFIIAIINSQL